MISKSLFLFKKLNDNFSLKKRYSSELKTQLFKISTLFHSCPQGPKSVFPGQSKRYSACKVFFRTKPYRLSGAVNEKKKRNTYICYFDFNSMVNSLVHKNCIESFLWNNFQIISTWYIHAKYVLFHLQYRILETLKIHYCIQ